MTTSSPATPSSPRAVGPLRIRIADDTTVGRVDGAWWPRSRDLQREAADLVDHFPAEHGRISRLLFSRPDWDESSKDGRGVRSIRAARGVVKVGSFPSDDTHLMVLSLSSGHRLKLLVIPSDTPSDEAEAQLAAGASGGASAASTAVRATVQMAVDSDRWDDESPAG